MQKLNKKNTILITAALFAGVGIITYLESTNLAQADKQIDKQVPHLPTASALKIDEQAVQIWKSFSGRTKAVDIVDVRPQVAGTITKVAFEDGQQVKKGDLLFVIDPRTYAAQVKKLEADLKAAINTEENAKRNLYRAQELRKTMTVSQSSFEDRETEYIVAQSSREAIQAELENAKVSLDYAYVKSPISGKISRAEVTVGNLVVAGGDALTTVVSDKEMYVDFEIDEQTYLTSVRSNSKDVPVKVKSVKDNKSYEGKVASFDNRINTSSGTIRARAIFANDDNALISGMFVSVEMGTPIMEKQILIPEKSIGTNQNRKFVYVINDNKVEYRGVELGESVNGNRIVKNGLQVGDVIIKEGLIKFRPGMPVQANFAE